jgi:hypothetical protein
MIMEFAPCARQQTLYEVKLEQRAGASFQLVLRSALGVQR